EPGRNVATCSGPIGAFGKPPHEAPAAGCGCGLYACHDIAELHLSWMVQGARYIAKMQWDSRFSTPYDQFFLTGVAGSGTVLDDDRRADGCPLVQEAHGVERHIDAAVRAVRLVGARAPDRTPGRVVDEVSAVVVEHRVFHPSARVPVGAALWPWRHELVGRVFGLDVEGARQGR